MKKAYPEMADGALSAVPFVVTLWPSLFMGLYTFSKRLGDVAGLDNTPKGAGHE